MTSFGGHHPNTATPSRAVDPTAAADFAQFYRDTAKPLVAFLINQGATLHEAADLAQDTLTKAFQRWCGLEHPRAWVHTVAGRALIRLRLDEREIPADPLPPSPLLRSGDIEHWELSFDIVRALGRLTDRQRQVMAWTLSGFTPAEIADALRLSGDVVRQHLMYARRTLSIHLSREEPRR